MSTHPAKPANARHDTGQNATPYQPCIQQQANSEPFWSRTFNDPITFFTFVLAVTTIGLLICNLLLWLANRKIVRFMGRQTTVAEKQSDLAEQQLALQAQQSDILTQQALISHEQFLADHRPRLVLKDVYFSGASDFGEVSFEIANAGGVTAVVTGGFIALDFVNDPREFKDFQNRSLEPLDRNGFLPGAVRPFAIRTTDKMQERLSLMRDALEDSGIYVGQKWTGEPTWPDVPFYFFGMIYYTEQERLEQGITRGSAFRRKWNPETGSFERTGNPDHEYAD